MKRSEEGSKKYYGQVQGTTKAVKLVEGVDPLIDSTGTKFFFPTQVEQPDIIQLSPEGDMNISGYIPRREALRYISTALHRP